MAELAYAHGSEPCLSNEVRVQVPPLALMTDTSTLETNTMSVLPDFQDNIHNDPDNSLNKIPGTSSIPGNKDAQVRVPTWSEQVTALRDDFMRGENGGVLLSLVDQEMRKYFAAKRQTPTDIDDLTQQVQIKLLEWRRKMISDDLPEDKMPRHFPGFIRRIGHNVLVDQFRSQKATFVESDFVDPTSEVPFFEKIPDESIPIDDQTTERIERMGNIALLYRIIPSLNPRQQTMLGLILQGQSNQQIAEVIGLNPRSTDKAMFDLRKKIKGLLEPEN